MQFTALQIRNLTTGRLHTNMGDIYNAIESIIGEKGIMTHQLVNAVDAMMPWLRAKIDDPRFWNDEYDPNHEGVVELDSMTPAERDDFFSRFSVLPSPLTGKELVIVIRD